MGSTKWVSSAPCRPSTFQRRILSLQLMVRSLSPCWMPSQVGTMALDSTGMVPSPGKNTHRSFFTDRDVKLCVPKWSTDIKYHVSVWGRCERVSSRTILHFGSELALLSVLKQGLMALHLIPRFTARLIKESSIPTRRRASDNREKKRSHLLTYTVELKGLLREQTSTKATKFC